MLCKGKRNLNSLSIHADSKFFNLSTLILVKLLNLKKRLIFHDERVEGENKYGYFVFLKDGKHLLLRNRLKFSFMWVSKNSYSSLKDKTHELNI